MKGNGDAHAKDAAADRPGGDGKVLFLASCVCYHLNSMKTFLLLAAFSMMGIQAQDAKKSDDKRPQNPIIAALDANHDGEIDSTEINNAPAALKKLDKNGDGKISRAELRAQRTDAADKPAKVKKNKKKLQ